MLHTTISTTNSESIDAMAPIQRYRGGSVKVLSAFGDMAAMFVEADVLLCGSSPAFKRFAAQACSLSWRVLPTEPSGNEQAPATSLLAIGVHSAQYNVELVLDPASALVRQCYAAWQRLGYVAILVKADKAEPKWLYLGVQSLNGVLPIWPMSVGWPVDPVSRMLGVVERFENRASRANTAQLSVMELADEDEGEEWPCIPSRRLRDETPKKTALT